MADKNKYCSQNLSYERWPTRVVKIGDLPLGGDYPIRLQSMTTTSTMDISGTVEQSIRMIEAGCEYVRITAPSINEAEKLAEIKKTLKARGYTVPLIADIHYTPKAAEVAARIVEKVRINPGNYHDRKQKNPLENSESDNAAEIENIYKKFSPLVKICKNYGTAMRIGTNHGSLSQRIMSRFGDTPLGMVESALEYIRICEDLNYYQLVLSMKSSNPIVMVQAYRLLVNRMMEEQMNYPLHLGVTEAGEGVEGRIKSAVGIGTLLEDGLGDTIRVSLTEEPEKEIPVARQIVKRYENRISSPLPADDVSIQWNPFEFNRRTTAAVKNIGGGQPPVAIQSAVEDITNQSLPRLGYKYIDHIWIPQNIHADYLYCEHNTNVSFLPDSLSLIKNLSPQTDEKDSAGGVLVTLPEYMSGTIPANKTLFLQVETRDFPDCLSEIHSNTVIVLAPRGKFPLHDLRYFIAVLMKKKITNPVVVKTDYKNMDDTEFFISAAIDLGALLVDGLCDGVWLEPSNELALNTIFSILQSTRARITKTDFISCPSCGRTLFDLQETSALIREKTGHLKGLKIAIMGCIVNGPGEMADADYGYVGSGRGRVTLYRGKTILKKNIKTLGAVDELVELIRQDGKWKDPSGEV